ncbi:MAG: BamA/TamA family outer membrane protein [Candidatus Eisenbacteria bacterium]|nr:BamA/TamA family outer membrane protein [Candidatus Eisenbacteria bacterium]MCC7141771.1 BamA/TamA family outer membrane protein [Candidatus Eisenbacteria bacterium]
MRIEIAGLARTRPEVIRRELWHRAGRPVDLARLGDDRDYLLDLGLFAQVLHRVRRDPATDRPVLVLTVAERPTFLALPTVDWDPENRFSYGVLASEDNLHGRGEALRLQGRIGGIRELSLGYGRRWTFDRRLGFSSSAYWIREKKTTEEIRETRRGLSCVLSPRRGRGSGIALNPGWERAESEPLQEADSARGRESDDHRWLGATVFDDTRHYRIRATHGRYVGLGLTRHGGPLGGDTDFWRGSVDLLGVVPTGGESGLTIATRLLWSEGTVPRYLRLNLGGTSTLRGYAHGEFGGDSRWIGWVEQVVPLLPRRTLRFERIGRTIDLTVDGAAFVDVGTVWDDDELQRGEAAVQVGGGLGLRILLPFVQVLRLELSTDGEEVRVDGAGGIRL